MTENGRGEGLIQDLSSYIDNKYRDEDPWNVLEALQALSEHYASKAVGTVTPEEF